MRYPLSYWQESANSRPRFSKVEENLKADVVVVGGGITGLMTAYELKKKGASVIVLEKERIGAGDTLSTTAHLTCMTDLRLLELIDSFGEDHAFAVWDAGTAAIERIHEVSHLEDISCSFKWVPGHFHVPRDAKDSDCKPFRREAERARAMGFECNFLESVPVVSRPGFRLENQAKFNPAQFVNGLADVIERMGRCIYEESEVTQFSTSDNTLTVNGHVVTADSVVMASHVPLQGRLSTPEATLFQTKLYPYTSYVIRAEIFEGQLEQALYWDSNDPYDYLRIDSESGGSFAILGGLDSKTGQEVDAGTKFAQLAEKLRTILPKSEVTHRWAGQVLETNDGLPFIGEMDKRQFVATGYAGNGCTFSVVAALIISDEVAGIKNPWRDLFHPGRFKLRGGTWDYIKENVDYPYYMAKQYLLRSADRGGIESLKCGEGGIFTVGDQRVAACRSAQGEIHSVSPNCTHMGCYVRWNTALESWDCPCHGSRFAPDGKVIGGPAEQNLATVKV